MSELEVQGQETPPEISAEGLEHYRQALGEYERMLADPATPPIVRQRYTALRQSVEHALAVTGQQLNPTDPRSPAQQYFDQRFAMEPSQQLVDMCRRDSGEAQNPQQVAKVLDGIGMTYKDALELAQHAVAQSKELAGVKVENLPPITLASLARYGQHIRRFGPNRPQ